MARQAAFTDKLYFSTGGTSLPRSFGAARTTPGQKNSAASRQFQYVFFVGSSFLGPTT
jgi:hypothetical protein